MAFNSITIDCSSDLGANVINFNYTQGAGTGTLQDFVIERSPDNITYTAIGTLTYTSDGAYVFNDTTTGVICNTLQYYMVQPRNTISGDFEAASSVVSCTKDCTVTPTNPTAAPTTNCASANSTSGITVSWSSYPGDSSHIAYLSTRVYKSTDGGTFSLLTTTTGSTNTYVDTAVAAGSNYRYYIQYLFSVFNTTSNISATSATCALSNNCRSDGPVTAFPFSITVDSDCNMIISDLMSADGSFVIPSSLACNDIGAITSMGLKVIKCNAEANDTSFTALNTAHPNWVSGETSFKWTGQEEGVWTFILQTVYTNLVGTTQTITTTKCAYLNCCHKCALAKEGLTTSKDITDAFLFMEVIDTAVACDDCYIACEYYEHLHKLTNRYDCNC